MRKSIGLAFILAICACGKGKEDALDPSQAPAEESPSQMVSVRVLGVRASGPVRVRVSDVQLKVDGNALAVKLDPNEIDLGDDQNAWAVTKFTLPVDARKVAIQLQFFPEGIAERDGKTHLLDLTGPPIAIVADAAQLRTRNKVVFELNMAESLIDVGDQVFFLPDFIVRY